MTKEKKKRNGSSFIEIINWHINKDPGACILYYKNYPVTDETTVIFNKKRRFLLRSVYSHFVSGEELGKLDRLVFSCGLSACANPLHIKLEKFSSGKMSAPKKTVKIKKENPVEIATPEITKRPTDEREKKDMDEFFMSETRRVLFYLNKKTFSNFTASVANIRLIRARMSSPENHTYEEIVNVIDKKHAEWIGTKFEQYLRPETLFGEKFESYLNSIGRGTPSTVSEMLNFDFNKYNGGTNGK